MSHLQEEASKGDVGEFRWGKRMGIGGLNGNISTYQSYTYYGIEYSLYDCVYLWGEPEELEPYIGKLIKLWETPKGNRKVKIVWFFRRTDIVNWLGDNKPKDNELFLASGEGLGLSNVNPLEAVVGKCSVVCTSRDRRNPQLTEAEVRMAEYFFYRTFDVGSCKISNCFIDRIDGIRVERFFNRRTDQTLFKVPNLKVNLEKKAAASSLSSTLELKDPITGMTEADRLLKKRKVLECGEASNTNIAQKFSGPPLRIHEGNDKSSCQKVADKSAVHNGVSTNNQVLVVTGRPDDGRRKWFTQLCWEERMKTAREVGTLVLLENLDPSYTLSEIKDLLWHVFKEKVDAKMMQQHAFSSPHYGQALVIFKSKEAASFVISKLNRKCLVLADGRPVVASGGYFQENEISKVFAGHLTLDKLTPAKQRDKTKIAVSTSHCSQPNTIEFEMAIEWRLLQGKSDLWWKSLHEIQVKEIEKVKSQFKVQ